jgi:hypothetical protein
LSKKKAFQILINNLFLIKNQSLPKEVKGEINFKLNSIKEAFFGDIKIAD